MYRNKQKVTDLTRLREISPRIDVMRDLPGEREAPCAKLIYTLRLSFGTVEEFCRAARIHENTYKNWISGNTTLTPAMLVRMGRLCQIYNMSAHQFRFSVEYKKHVQKWRSMKAYKRGGRVSEYVGRLLDNVAGELLLGMPPVKLQPGEGRDIGATALGPEPLEWEAWCDELLDRVTGCMPFILGPLEYSEQIEVYKKHKPVDVVRRTLKVNIEAGIGPEGVVEVGKVHNANW